MKLKYFLLLLTSYFIITISCNTTEPPPPDETKPTLTLALDDVSCTEAWLQLTTKDLELPAELTLKQYNPTGDSVAKVFNLSSLDTLLYIDSLLSNQTYNYQISGIWHPVSGNQQQVSSNKLSVTTMDTTSHNFTWQTWTFGEHSNSVFYDVAIIDENNIWAVGEIYTKDSYTYDSLGNWIDPYNAVHWNGYNWELVRIYYNYNGSDMWSPISTILAFSSNDIWFGAGIHWDGIDFITKPMNISFPYHINKMWGTSSNDFYIVGNNGNIAHYNGSGWAKIESGTTVDLLDVWGSPEGTVWTCGYSGDYAVSVLLRFDGTNWNKIYEGPSSDQNNNEYIGPTSGVWTNSEFFTYVASWGKIYRQPNNNILNIQRVTPNFSDVAFAIRGTNHNNIFIAGQHGLVGHYNGITYKEMTELKNENEYLFKIDVKNNKAVGIGYNYQGLAGSTAVIHLININ